MTTPEQATANRERLERVVAASQGAAAGGAVGAGASLALVLALSAVGSVVPVLGTSVGALVGAGAAWWLRRAKEKAASKARTV